MAAKTSHYDVLELSNRDSESEIKEAALPIDVEKIGLNSRDPRVGRDKIFTSMCVRHCGGLQASLRTNGN